MGETTALGKSSGLPDKIVVCATVSWGEAKIVKTGPLCSPHEGWEDSPRGMWLLFEGEAECPRRGLCGRSEALLAMILQVR